MLQADQFAGFSELGSDFCLSFCPVSLTEPLFETHCSYVEARLAEFLSWIQNQADADVGPFIEYPKSEFWAYADYKYIAILFQDLPSMFEVALPVYRSGADDICADNCGPNDDVQQLFEGFRRCCCLLLDWRENGPAGGFPRSRGQDRSLSDGQMAIPDPQLIHSYSVIINCLILFFRSAFALNYLLLTKGQQPIKYEMEKQI